MLSPIILTAFGDNYIYLLEYAAGKVIVVDPGDASVVTAALAGENMTLTHILATHHHADHIGGIGTLKRQFGCKVVSSDKKRIPETDITIKDSDTFMLETVNVQVIATPGHTQTGVCYYLTGPTLENPLLFTGDTLFVCGCGRLFECDGKTMYQSFEKLIALPNETLVYPGHDYTRENLRFALTLEPENKDLKQKLSAVDSLNRQKQPTVPATLEEEKQLNPFLRAVTWQQFAKLRRQKDSFY